MPSRALKGRHFWRLCLTWLRMRLRKALNEAQAEVVLLDDDASAVHVTIISAVVPQVLRCCPNSRLNLMMYSRCFAVWYRLEQMLPSSTR